MSITTSALSGLLKAGSARNPDRSLPPDQLLGADFASLLEKARAGEISSNRPISIARGADVRLSDDQLARLAAAADRAEAEGATRALVLIDGLKLKLDVSMREVLGQVSLEGGQVLTGIDSVVSIPAAAGKDPSILPLPAPGVGNPSLLELLSAPGGKPSRGA